MGYGSIIVELELDNAGEQIFNEHQSSSMSMMIVRMKKWKKKSEADESTILCGRIYKGLILYL